MIAKIALWIALALLVLFLLPACNKNPNSPRGFRLPEGDSTVGRETFIAKGCIQCHTVHEDSLPISGQPSDIVVALGGPVTRAQTYGQLVTSIINPSHVIKANYQGKYTDADGKSLMPDFTSELTVREMIDITEYLQSKYEIVIPEHPYSHSQF